MRKYANLDNIRVYMVEDDQRNIALHEAILEMAGAIVFINNSGKNIIEDIKVSLPINIILMDLRLPKTTGYSEFIKIKHDVLLSSIPVVVVSASNESEELNRARRAGFSGYISKPLNNLQEFTHHLKSIIDGTEVWGG